MNNQPEPQAAPLVPLTQSLLAVWGNLDLIMSANLPGAGIQQWELYVLSKHDLALKHSLPK
jgi:hypothetical protein